MTTLSNRRTIVAHGRLAMRELRLDAARQRRHGVQIMSFEQLAVRLAGGFARPIDDECLRTAIQAALPDTILGELESIKLLPGMVDAAADTLHKAWRAGIDLAARAGDHPRLDSIARLEAAILAQLPPGMMRPTDLVARALERVAHAHAVLGPVEIVGITELSPCWRPLLQELTAHTSVSWTAGPRPTPPWLDAFDVTINRADPTAPAISTVSAATAYHEAIEAIRWARGLLASGEAEPADIAIAAASTGDYDDHLLALRADANLRAYSTKAETRRLRVASRSRAFSRRARQKRVISRTVGPVGGTPSHRLGKMVSRMCGRSVWSRRAEPACSPVSSVITI